MMWRSISVLVLSLLISSCSRKKEEFKQHSGGYYWKLNSFTNESKQYPKGKIAWLNAVFSTQNDSVFYDSKHDMRDRFFVNMDTSQKNELRAVISQFTEGDSVTVLMHCVDFFHEQFKSNVPFFSEKDSIVKLNFKVKKLLMPAEYSSVIDEMKYNETMEIQAFFGSAEKMNAAKDSSGFYWVERPTENKGESIKSGETITLHYIGSFLDGRSVDISPEEFTLSYGTPDQILKGLNYVIGRLKIGDDSKIILPSQLAFGEEGSSNGSIPPFTPMHYSISIKNKK